MKRLVAAAVLVALAGPAFAGAAEDLTAAGAAADKGVRDEAIRLFTQAMSSGDLKSEDRVIALRRRGGEYSSKSLIADNFGRPDEARRMRENAIADFSEAIKLKADDPDLYADRAQTQHLNGLYDAALADFDASLKLRKSAITLIQRAASARAKGDYDRAAADYSAALALQPRDTGMDDADILTERGFNAYLAGRFEDAAADFATAISAGAAERVGDVLWLPYQATWLHLARARAGKDDAEELKANASRVDLKAWPGTLIAHFLGETSLEQAAGGGSHGGLARGRDCALNYFAGQAALAKGDKAAAGGRLARAREICNIHTNYALGSRVELAKLGR